MTDRIFAIAAFAWYVFFTLYVIRETRKGNQMSDNERAGDVPALNTDRELWREIAGDYYSPSIHVTKDGGIGINVGGTVRVRTLREWHSSVQLTRIAELQAELAECSYGESNVKSYREIAETIDRQDAELTALRARREADCRAMGEAKEEIDVALNWLKWCCGDVGCESKLEAALAALAAQQPPSPPREPSREGWGRT